MVVERRSGGLQLRLLHVLSFKSFSAFILHRSVCLPTFHQVLYHRATRNICTHFNGLRQGCCFLLPRIQTAKHRCRLWWAFKYICRKTGDCARSVRSKMKANVDVCASRGNRTPGGSRQWMLTHTSWQRPRLPLPHWCMAEDVNLLFRLKRIILYNYCCVLDKIDTTYEVDISIWDPA